MLHLIIRRALRLLAVVGIGFASCTPAAASHLVTGNGFGFAVVAPESGMATKFYPHPHSYTRPDPANPLSEGIETPKFIKTLGCGTPGRSGRADYVEDFHVIRLRGADGSGTFFMPFGLNRPALIIASDTARWRVEWGRPLRSRKAVSGGQLLRFDGIDEPLLLIPLAGLRKAPANQPLAASLAWALIALERESEAAVAIREFTRWRAGLSAQALVNREIAQFEQWRAKPSVHFKSEKERHLWRQSEMMLRMAQSREPNRPGRYGNGLIVAALPDVILTPWVRDMAWATAALIRMGHRRRRVPRFSPISTPGRPAKCGARSMARTTRSRWCAIGAMARKNPSSPRRAPPTSSSTIGAKCSGCWANICASTTTRRCSRPLLIAVRCTRAPAISS